MFALIYGILKLYWWMIKLSIVMVIAMFGFMWWMCLMIVWIFSPDKQAMSGTINRFGRSFGRTMRTLL
jgi:hypothetical protein